MCRTICSKAVFWINFSEKRIYNIQLTGQSQILQFSRLLNARGYCLYRLHSNTSFGRTAYLLILVLSGICVAEKSYYSNGFLEKGLNLTKEK